MGARPAAIVRLGVAAALLYEGLSAAARVSRVVVFFAVYDAVVFVMAGLRGLVIALDVAAVVMLVRRQPAGPRFATIALLASAALKVFEIGLALSPSSLPPGYRWPAVALYWGYAAALTLLLRRTQAAR